jgi:hypothetical protein
MTKTLTIIALLAAAVAPASADPLSGRSVSPRTGTLNESHITGTGETVPNPGASQSSGTTSLDRGVYRRDQQIENSVCKGC